MKVVTPARVVLPLDPSPAEQKSGDKVLTATEVATDLQRGLRRGAEVSQCSM
jgi:hypothetical protein